MSEHDASNARAQREQINELLTNQQVLTVQVQQLMLMVQGREANCGSLQSTVASMQSKIHSDAALTHRAEGRCNLKKQELIDRQEEYRRMEAALIHHQAQVADLQRQLTKAQTDARTADDNRLLQAHADIADVQLHPSAA